MQFPDDREYLYEIGGWILVLIFCFLLLESLYVLCLLLISYVDYENLVHPIVDRDNSYNV